MKVGVYATRLTKRRDQLNCQRDSIVVRRLARLRRADAFELDAGAGAELTREPVQRHWCRVALRHNVHAAVGGDEQGLGILGTIGIRRVEHLGLGRRLAGARGLWPR